MIYRWTREFHLYFGLFVSPFILLFAGSVFYLNHGKLFPAVSSVHTYRELQIPERLDSAKGADAVERAKRILPQIEVEGEIGFLRYLAEDRHLIFPVSKAGVEAMVDLDLDARSATVKRRGMSFGESIAYLHKMPGPHNVAIRGNWIGTRAWGWFADATIYLLLFITLTGVYLWWAIKAERRVGTALLTAGAATLAGLVYAALR